MDKENDNNKEMDTKKMDEKKPNDIGTIVVDAFVKIYDPNTKEVFVERRA